MGKRKRFIILGIVLLLVAGGVTEGVLFLRHRTKRLPGIVEGTGSTPKLAKLPAPMIDDFESAQALMTAKKWKEASTALAGYGNGEANDLYLRISAYGYCVYTATTDNNPDLAADCDSKGKSLIAQLKSEEDKDFATRMFAANTKNEVFKDEAAAKQDKNHE